MGGRWGGRSDDDDADGQHRADVSCVFADAANKSLFLPFPLSSGACGLIFLISRRSAGGADSMPPSTHTQTDSLE